ncbi:hypothetical protein LWF15_14800 [Kineosporia rhizophila]|uniref:hypothetical protein n=1 Tax=Kineosporia rhizophila TaxID=84633 RepID=UPI001E448869|nr:hypothetical protein [Kineosporia rhizophila]MCE0536774.1 hypothetical protein [Kineosporia rhizophila]
MRPRPSLPEQARHEAVARLIGLGLYHEAQGLLSIDEPVDAELGMLSSLLAGDPQAAAKFLGRRMMAQNARAGEVDLVRGCIALVSGHDENLAGTEQVLAQMKARSQDWAAFAVSAAPHDLHAAARAAAMVTEQTGPAVLAVLAAARAVGGDAQGAQKLLEAGENGVGDDPRRKTVELLKTHGYDVAVQALEAARFQRHSFAQSMTRRYGAWRRRRDERDLQCRCATTPVWAGESSRYYVNWHLELLESLSPEPDETAWRILFCARSGVRYLDRSSIPVSVRIGAFTGSLETWLPSAT